MVIFGANSSSKNVSAIIRSFISDLPLFLSNLSDYREIHHNIIFHLYRTTSRRIRLDAIVALFESIFAVGAKLLWRYCRRDRNSDSLRHPVEGQIAVHDEAVIVIARLLHVADRDRFE